MSEDKKFEQFQYENPEFTIEQIKEEYERNLKVAISRVPVEKRASTNVYPLVWGMTKRNLLKQVGGVEGIYQGSSSGEIVQLEGVLIGVGEYRDRAQEIRDKAKKVVENNGVGEAMASNPPLVDRDGRVLDTRKKIFGKSNDKYGEPLDPSLKLKEMGLYAACRESGTDNPFTYTRFQTSDNALAEAWAKVDVNEHLAKPYTTYGKIRVDEYGFLVYGLTGADNRTIFKTMEGTLDVDRAINEALGQYMTPIGDAYEAYKMWLPKVKGTNEPDMSKKLVPWNAIIAVKGCITDIQRERADFWKGMPAKMWDLEDVAATVDVYLPPQYKTAPWGDYTTGIAFGKPDEVWVKSEDSGKYDKRSGRVEIRAYGFLPMEVMMDSVSQDTLSQSTLEYNAFEN